MTHYRWPLLMAVLFTLLAGCSREPSSISLEQLRQQTHIHGLAFDRADSERLWLATHHGFYAMERNGKARRVSEETHDFMGFAPHPEEAETFLASGHTATGGNLGVVKSRDGGRSWSRHAAGVDGPVDFHQLTISAASPGVLYGAHAGQLQVSEDGVYPERRPASLVVANQGTLYAFMLDVGMLRAEEASLDWEVVRRGWGERYLMHLAADPNAPPATGSGG